MCVCVCVSDHGFPVFKAFQTELDVSSISGFSEWGLDEHAASSRYYEYFADAVVRVTRADATALHFSTFTYFIDESVSMSYFISNVWSTMYVKQPETSTNSMCFVERVGPTGARSSTNLASALQLKVR